MWFLAFCPTRCTWRKIGEKRASWNLATNHARLYKRKSCWTGFNMFFYSASGHGRHTGINMERHAVWLQRLWNWWTQMLMMVAININQWLNSEKHLIHIAHAAVQNHEMWSYHAYGMTLLGVEALKYAQGYVPQIVVLYVVLTNKFHAN